MATQKFENSDSGASGINRICEGTKIVGTIESASDIRIDGIVEGSVISKGRVVVGEKGKIKGDFICSCLDVSGTVDGKITTEDVLTLKNKSVVTGEVVVKKLIVESGAVFNGTCKMVGSGAQTISSNQSSQQQQK